MTVLFYIAHAGVCLFLGYHFGYRRGLMEAVKRNRELIRRIDEIGQRHIQPMRAVR